MNLASSNLLCVTPNFKLHHEGRAPHAGGSEPWHLLKQLLFLFLFKKFVAFEGEWVKPWQIKHVSNCRKSNKSENAIEMSLLAELPYSLRDSHLEERLPQEVVQRAMARFVSVEVWTAVAVVFLCSIAYQVGTKLLWKGLWTPLRLGRILRKQGVQGPPFRFLFGQLMESMAYRDSFPEVVPLDSNADLLPTVTPTYALFFPKFPGAKYFLYWFGTSTRLVVRDPEIAKEVFITNHASLGRYLDDSFVTRFLGNGLLLLVGEKWTIERRTISPFFHQDALKGMVAAMVEGSATEIHKWEQMVAQGGGSAEIDVEPDVHKLSGRVLSLTLFGGEYETGVQVYEKQAELATTFIGLFKELGFWLIPHYRHIPTKKHRHINRMVNQLDTLLYDVINKRREAVRNEEASSYGEDLLGCMLAGASNGWQENTVEFNLASVMNNCKLFYFAGQDSVANNTIFMLLMMAMYPEWQERARKEVMEVVGEEEKFDAKVLSHLKVVGMIANETMRNFSIVPTIERIVVKDIQLKSLLIPKGVRIEFAMSAVHQDKTYWGEDTASFNPERFAHGVAAACSHPQAFLPFGIGPKFCVGNNFAMMEMKMIVARVLRRFRVLPSPNYKHHPTYVLVTRPKFGMPLIFQAL